MVATSRAEGSRPFVSVIVPIYNEADVVERNIRKISLFLRQSYPSHELIVVDDGSKDNSGMLVGNLCTTVPNLRFLTYGPNRGKGHAVRTGAREATGDWIALVDADLELPIDLLPNFFEVQQQTGALIVAGSKRDPRSAVVYPKNRMLLSNAYNRLVRTFFGLQLTDTQLGFKLIHSSVLKDIISPLLVKRYAFDLELLVVESMRGVKISEAPVRLLFSRPGSGRLNLATSVSVLRETLGIWFRRYVTGYYAKRIPPLGNDLEGGRSAAIPTLP